MRDIIDFIIYLGKLFAAILVIVATIGVCIFLFS